MDNINKTICPRCNKEMVFKEYSSDFYSLTGEVCIYCGYFLISSGWVESKMIRKGSPDKASS